MVKRLSTKKPPPQDRNVAALEAVRRLTRQGKKERDREKLQSEAVRLPGKLGGSKGGKERARRLSKRRKVQIAQGRRAGGKAEKRSQGSNVNCCDV